MDRLKAKIRAAVRGPAIRPVNLDPAELTSAVETILARTGDLGLATENLENLALAIQATRAGL